MQPHITYVFLLKGVSSVWEPALKIFLVRIIIGSDRRPETKQRIEGKIVRFRSGSVKDRVRVRDN